MERQHGFSIATDPAVRKQYFELRAREYQRTFGFDGSWLKQEDGYDRSGTILVYTGRDGRVAAGARINIATPEDPMRLPMEYGGFSLRMLLPQLDLEGRRYAEVSRLAVAAELQDSVMLIRLLDILHDFAKAKETQLVFSICPKVQARHYRIMVNTRQVTGKKFVIYNAVAVPAQFDIDMKLCLFHEEGAI